MRVVFDTNIFISAFAISGSQAEKAIMRILEGQDTLLISKNIIKETLSVLSTKFSHDREAISRVAVYLSELAEIITPEKKIHILKDDPDNRILECAVDGNADVIVTGDKEMLKMKKYKLVKIVSLKNYLNKIK